MNFHTLYKYSDYLLSLPKSIYFCLKMFPLRTALRLPVIVSRYVWLEELRGRVELPEHPRVAGIRIGFGRVGIFDYTRSRTILQLSGGTVSFRGGASLGQGTRISMGPHGHLIFGDGVCITAESSIICYDRIEIGDDSLISWECQLMDTDFHSIRQSDAQEGSTGSVLLNPDAPIYIGRHCWICSRCMVLKGSTMEDDCVLGGGAVRFALCRMIHIRCWWVRLRSLCAGTSAGRQMRLAMIHSGRAIN